MVLTFISISISIIRLMYVNLFQLGARRPRGPGGDRHRLGARRVFNADELFVARLHIRPRRPNHRIFPPGACNLDRITTSNGQINLTRCVLVQRINRTGARNRRRNLPVFLLQLIERFAYFQPFHFNRVDVRRKVRVETAGKSKRFWPFICHR